MDTEKVIQLLQQKGLDDITELIEDAKSGDLEELELVESIGLVHDPELNRSVIKCLQDLGVQIIYVTDEEEDDEEA